MSTATMPEEESSTIAKLGVALGFGVGLALFGVAVWYPDVYRIGARAKVVDLPDIVRAVVLIQNGNTNGSGFLVDAVGTVLTNEHVVGAADTVRLRTSDGRDFAAKVLARHTSADVAILRILGSPQSAFPFLFVSEADEIQQGERVYVIGFPLGASLSDQPNTTGGVVSGTQIRGRYIGTDAAINPGNSGGPLVSLDRGGEVVGIVVAKVEDVGVENIGLALPIRLGRDLYQQITGRPLRSARQ